LLYTSIIVWGRKGNSICMDLPPISSCGNMVPEGHFVRALLDDGKLAEDVQMNLIMCERDM
jgi:hypothetical protein